MTTKKVMHYFRCIQCLNPFSVLIETQVMNDGSLWHLKRPKLPEGISCECGNLEHFEHMDRVSNVEYLPLEESRPCECNEICLSARGPNCSCKCNGRNHGHGVLTFGVAKHSPKAKTAGELFNKVSSEYTSGELFGNLANYLETYRNWKTKNKLNFETISAISEVERIFKQFQDARTEKKREKLYQVIVEFTRAKDARE